jgi:hypothetical protein
MSWRMMLILALLAIVFINGVGLSSTADININLIVWIVCSVLIAAIIIAGEIPKNPKDNPGVKKVTTIILMALVLIPLAFLGTCVLSFGGVSVGGLFRR